MFPIMMYIDFLVGYSGVLAYPNGPRGKPLLLQNLPISYAYAPIHSVIEFSDILTEEQWRRNPGEV